MCCSDYDDCDFDILMMVLHVRCFAEPNLKKTFVARVIIGILFDGIEGLSIEFKEIDDNINIYLIGLAAVLYAILCICIVVNYRREQGVYTFNYVISFKVISLVVAFIIFYTTSNFDWNTIEQLYNHLADSNFTDIFLTAINIVSFLDIILSSFSLIFLIWKIHKAVKEGKGTYCKVLFKFDFSSASEDGSATGQNNKTYSTETPNSSNEAK